MMIICLRIFHSTLLAIPVIKYACICLCACILLHAYACILLYMHVYLHAYACTKNSNSKTSYFHHPFLYACICMDMHAYFIIFSLYACMHTRNRCMHMHAHACIKKNRNHSRFYSFSQND